MGADGVDGGAGGDGDEPQVRDDSGDEVNNGDAFDDEHAERVGDDDIDSLPDDPGIGDEDIEEALGLHTGTGHLFDYELFEDSEIAGVNNQVPQSQPRRFLPQFVPIPSLTSSATLRC